MVSEEIKNQVEFGDFQTPDELSLEVCERLKKMGICPDIVIEPTCGLGSFIKASVRTFPSIKTVFGFDVNASYINTLKTQLVSLPYCEKIHVVQGDFFKTNWDDFLANITGTLLVLGNFPWVTNAGQGSIGGENLPEKSNFQNRTGFSAITGKANFDISEWMLIQVLRWFEGRTGDVAMLVKTAVGRKILAHSDKYKLGVSEAQLIGIDAKKYFKASVDASLLVIRLSGNLSSSNYDYKIYNSFQENQFVRVGHRMGLTIGNLESFERNSNLVGVSPQKWRSGIKHDASQVMEFTRTSKGFVNGYGETNDLELTYLYPLLKGSDIGSNKNWREKFIMVTQKKVGEATDRIRTSAPLTWNYLLKYSDKLDSRGSSIYAKNPRFSIFGIGDYAFRPWRIAICGLYKILKFRLVGPLDGKPVMFDDTVYYLSFDTEDEAVIVLEKINSTSAYELLSSLIFWDEKRPIKSEILNRLDWSRV